MMLTNEHYPMPPHSSASLHPPEVLVHLIYSAVDRMGSFQYNNQTSKQAQSGATHHGPQHINIHESEASKKKVAQGKKQSGAALQTAPSKP